MRLKNGTLAYILKKISREKAGKGMEKVYSPVY